MAAIQARTAARETALPAAQSVRLQALLAILLGLFVVGMAGFSHSDILHNASHDTRHSNAFPCH